jgi:glutaredoxin
MATMNDDGADEEGPPVVRPAPRGVWWGLVAIVLAASAGSQWWAQQQDGRIGSELAALARPGDIRMLSSETCTYCSQARSWMSRQHVAFSECFVERDAACAARYRASMMSGTPVVVVRGQTQLGFDPSRVMRRLGEPPG